MKSDKIKKWEAVLDFWVRELRIQWDVRLKFVTLPDFYHFNSNTELEIDGGYFNPDNFGDSIASDMAGSAIIRLVNPENYKGVYSYDAEQVIVRELLMIHDSFSWVDKEDETAYELWNVYFNSMARILVGLKRKADKACRAEERIAELEAQLAEKIRHQGGRRDKYTKNQRKAISDFYAQPGETYQSTAAYFGISTNTVGRILKEAHEA